MTRYAFKVKHKLCNSACMENRSGVLPESKMCFQNGIQNGTGRKDARLFSYLPFRFSSSLWWSMLLMCSAISFNMRKKIKLVKTKHYIVCEKLIFENSPALHKGVLLVLLQGCSWHSCFCDYESTSRHTCRKLGYLSQHNGIRIPGESQITVHVAKFIRLIFDKWILRILIRSLINTTL